MTNPLIAKWEEIHGKKEEPKKVEYELTPEFFEELKKLSSTNISVTTNCTNLPVSTSNISITKPRKLAKCYDPDDLKISFYQVADKIEQGKAKVASMSMDRNIMSGAKITFEVYVDDL
jgi:hypothetical protein